MKKLIILLILFPSLAFSMPMISFEWDEPVTGVPDEYVFYSDGVEVGRVPGDIRTVTIDAALLPDTDNSMTVRACGVKGCSADSNAVILKKIPGAPQNMRLAP